MRRSRGRGVQVGRLADFDRRLAAGATTLRGWRVRGVDLSARAAALDEAPGGRGDSSSAAASPPATPSGSRRAARSWSPACPSRRWTSTASTSTARRSCTTRRRYAEPLDARAYAWSQASHDRDDSLARALHDHAIDEALDALGRAAAHLVGVMGGHAARARVGRATPTPPGWGMALGAGHVVATGGGPGAMEAANLGGYLSGLADPPAALDAALAAAGAGAVVPAVGRRLGAGRLRRCGRCCPAAPTRSGIPTWHYGHEPPNVFATVIAKYFRNAQPRGDPARGLRRRHRLPARAPAAPSRRSSRTPARTTTPTSRRSRRWCWSAATYWTEDLPAWPLLRSLARGRPMEPHVHLVDDVDEAAALFEGQPSGTR